MLCATHDTGSAVEGIPMEGENLYVSSGTWSLLGVKPPKPITDKSSMEANYSNEGGAGYNRYQKNIMPLSCLETIATFPSENILLYSDFHLKNRNPKKVNHRFNDNRISADYNNPRKKKYDGVNDYEFERSIPLSK